MDAAESPTSSLLRPDVLKKATNGTLSVDSVDDSDDLRAIAIDYQHPSLDIVDDSR